MKIAVFHELPYGGARRVANDFSKELKKRHQVDEFIVGEKKDNSERDFFSRVHFYKFVEKKWLGSNWRVRLYKDTVELYRLYFLHRKIAKDIDKHKYDIVLVHPSKFTQAPFVLRFLKTHRVYYAHEVYRIMYEKYFMMKHSGSILKDLYEFITRRIKKRIDRKNISYAQRIFVNSENTKKNVLKFYARKSIVCYPGIDRAFFKKGKVKKKNDILFVGSTNDNTDGFFDLKNAIDRLGRKIRLEAVGNGNRWIEDKELLSLYARSKITFCGAHSEPFGLVPLEAIACGGRVIAVNEGGYRETAFGNSTLLVERNVGAIANAIVKTLRKKSHPGGKSEFRKKWSLTSRTRALEKELFSVTKSVKHLKKV